MHSEYDFQVLMYFRSLENNFLTGSIPATIWQNKSFSTKARLKM